MTFRLQQSRLSCPTASRRQLCLHQTAAHVCPYHPEAKCFSLVAALDRAGGEEYSKLKLHFRARDLLMKWVKHKALIFWNDDPQRTRDEVVKALRDAAAHLPKRPRKSSSAED